jgi:hypothetical protein
MFLGPLGLWPRGLIRLSPLDIRVILVAAIAASACLGPELFVAGRRFELPISAYETLERLVPPLAASRVPTRFYPLILVGLGHQGRTCVNSQVRPNRNM